MKLEKYVVHVIVDDRGQGWVSDDTHLDGTGDEFSVCVTDTEGVERIISFSSKRMAVIFSNDIIHRAKQEAPELVVTTNVQLMWVEVLDIC